MDVASLRLKKQNIYRYGVKNNEMKNFGQCWHFLIAHYLTIMRYWGFTKNAVIEAKWNSYKVCDWKKFFNFQQRNEYFKNYFSYLISLLRDKIFIGKQQIENLYASNWFPFKFLIFTEIQSEIARKLRKNFRFSQKVCAALDVVRKTM